MTPTVSTIIPAYNSADFVRAAIESALAQSGVDQEIFVIDDGSTDATPDVLRGFGDSIRVLRQTNGGPVKARNHGAELASGEWLAFLDADDQWLPDKLSKQLALASADVGLVYTDRENFGSVDRLSTTRSVGSPLHDGDLFDNLLFSNFITTSSAMIRRDWFTRLGGFREELRVCEDWDLWLRFSAAGGRAAVVREPLTHYRWHASSTSNNQLRMCEGRLSVLQTALSTPRGRQLPAQVRHRALACAWACSAWHAMPWRRTRAAWWYLRAIRHWPWDLANYKQLVKCCLPLPC